VATQEEDRVIPHPATVTPRRRIRVPKTGELVAADLRRQIVRGELVEGDNLPSETALMGMFGVSRPTLREAFRLLEAEALISIQRGSHGGAKVHSPNGEVGARYAGLILEHKGVKLADVYEARAVIEPTCARMVAERRTKADLARLWEAVERADEAHKTKDTGAILIQSDFHWLTVELAGNETLLMLWTMLRHIIERATESRTEGDVSADDAAHLGARSHRRLVELIEAKDADGTERLWRKHLTETSRFLLNGPGAETVLDLLD
jgi:DNA-binding FadR family transcriptional regulator